MPIVYLVRHGPAEPEDPARWPTDSDRPLSRDGIRRTRSAARAFARVVGRPDAIASSPARRALTTARLWREATGLSAAVAEWPELGLDGSAGRAFRRLQSEGREHESMVLVGHAPGLIDLMGIALTGEAVPLAHLGRAGAAAIEFPSAIAPGSGRLQWLVTRKMWRWDRPD
ncbi:MAG: histidine phosphatase family protein [Thermoplasmata archaeon]